MTGLEKTELPTLVDHLCRRFTVHVGSLCWMWIIGTEFSTAGDELWYILNDLLSKYFGMTSWMYVSFAKGLDIGADILVFKIQEIRVETISTTDVFLFIIWY